MACTVGDQKCIGDNLYECRGHYDPHTGDLVTGWVLIERDSPQCVVEPPPPPPPPNGNGNGTYHLDIHVPSWAAGGYVTPGSGDYPANRIVKLTAHPLSGYQFTGWGGDASGTKLTYNLYMNSDKYVEAYFEKVAVTTYHLDIHVPSWAAGGSVDPDSGDYPVNSTVRLTAQPLPGYQFTGWGGDASGVNPTYNLYMDSDKYVEAYFEKARVIILERKLDYNGNSKAIPVSGVPSGVRGKIRVVGRNDSNDPVEMGCTWVVQDPLGHIVETHTDDWAGLGAAKDVDPEDTHEFISFLDEGFDIDKAGTWTISIGLFIDAGNPTMVDSYEGILCVVEELAGTIVKKELEYSGSGNGGIPASDVPLGLEGLVHIWGQNNTTIKQALGISWVVKDPDGLLVERYPENKDIEWSDTGAGHDHEFIGGDFEFFKEGIYTIAINLYMNQDDPVIVDSYGIDTVKALCTVVAEEPEPPPPECAIDADCPAGYVCQNGVCVLAEEAEKEFPWVPVALIGGGVVLAAVTLIPKKPKA